MWIVQYTGIAATSQFRHNDRIEGGEAITIGNRKVLPRPLGNGRYCLAEVGG
jgi:selenophosphate synthase